MTAYMLKLIAIICMVLDHAGCLIYMGQLSWMRFIGRIAFPIFAFQISEGYIHTHNLKKYYIKLILFAIISQIPYAWFQYCLSSSPSLNIIFTLILGLLSITIYDVFIKISEHVTKDTTHSKKSQKSINDIQFLYKLCGIMIAIVIALIADGFDFDYGFYGVFLIFLFYAFRKNKILMNLAVIAITLIYYIPFWLTSNFNIAYIVLFFFGLIPLIFVDLYNGKKGKNFKMAFYIFYPVHLTLLCIIYNLLI